MPTKAKKRNHFCNITRESKKLRDRYLLKQIEKLLEANNKIMVVYGGAYSCNRESIKTNN